LPRRLQRHERRRDGDGVVICRLKKHLISGMREPCAKRHRFVTLTAPHRAARTAAGKCFLDMLGVFAEFETNLRANGSLRASRGQGCRGLQGPASVD
jgi:hypothetical protein